MKKLVCSLLVAAACVSSLAHAESKKAVDAEAAHEMHGKHDDKGMDGMWDKKRPANRQEAIERTEKKLEKLKAMKDDEWQKMEQERQARRKQWHNMSDDERKAARKELMERQKTSVPAAQ